MNRPSFIAFTIALFLASDRRADAQCLLPPNPAVFCGLGTTAIRGTVVDAESADPPPPNGALRVAILAVAGEPLEGIAVGEDVDLTDESEFAGPSVLTPPSAGAAIFVLRDAQTFVVGAPVGADDRVAIEDFRDASLPAEYVLTIAVDPDTDRCADVAFEVVDPPVPRVSSGQCNDEVGCSAAGPAVAPALTILLALASVRRRQHPKQGSEHGHLRKGRESPLRVDPRPHLRRRRLAGSPPSPPVS